ncbi:glycine zipper domain-containing protein [Candidatus Magnetaquicoccus inordinatus]|uniref:glycine zipper domain-containing protein n=1 Tax=Candidatus Magnetaquicoccus inordinatus TaxID=2496818 RepID=UPI001D0EF97D|nr:glycine zipper domain-containing protein [Candidatus Magnetaquicoccus inordinatus]
MGEMKQKSWAGVFLLVGTLFCQGCVENRAQAGAGVGALGGGLLGSLAGPAKNRGQNALIGAAVGGLAGYAVGNEMDKQDRQRINHAYERLPDNQPTAWTNPNNGHHYSVTPRSTTQNAAGQPCRQAEIESIIDGRRETVVKMACRRPDGTWEF